MIRKSSFHRYAFALMFLPSISIFLTNCGGGGESAPDLSPAVTTSAATSVTINSAVLNAVVNPKGLSTTAFFEYSKDPGLATPTPTTIQLLGSGSADNLVTQSISGLDQGATYYFRLKATNSAGTKVGQTIPFSTLPLPAATTTPVTLITTSGADLHAIVNPNGRATNAWFEWGATTSFGNILDNSSLGSGTDNVTINATLSGLLPAKTYHYRIVANNSVGTSVGNTIDFNTAGGVPTVGTKQYTLLSPTGATLNGDVNPSGLATFAWFEYGTTTSFGSILDNTSRGSGTDNVPMSAALSGLAPGTQIFYRVAASNTVGPSLKGDTFNFTTLIPTTVTTLPVSSLGANIATLNGSVTPPGLATTAWFEWGTDNTFTSGVTETPLPHQAIGSGTVNVAVNAVLSGLSTSTTYYFRLVASNSGGTTRGSILSFTTGAVTTVTTLPVSSLGAIVATLNGSVAPPGLETIAWFEYGTDPTLTSSTSTTSQPLGSGTEDVPVNAALSGLSAYMTYYYRIAASNSAGTTRGSISSFTTNAPTDYYDFGFTGNQAPDTGVFSVDFCPTAKNSPGGQFVLRLQDDFNTYFEVSNYDWDNPADPHPKASVSKVRNRVTVDNVEFTNSYSQGNCYTVKITFSPTVTTVEAFGETIHLTANTLSNPVYSFMVETTNQDAYLANIIPPLPF